jgi:RNA polymerase sigma factor (sigma-70 family)
VLLEIWRTASRFDPARGSAAAWALTIAHRRAVDRVRSDSASSRRERKVAEDMAPDDVAEVVAATLDHQRVRRCLGGLTDLQRESIKLAYYGGYTYPQVAQLLGVALGTVKTRIRDGLIRMRARGCALAGRDIRCLAILIWPRTKAASVPGSARVAERSPLLVLIALAFWPYPRSATAFIFSRVARMPSRLVRRRAHPATLQ